jgi:hypothetical protein
VRDNHNNQFILHNYAKCCAICFKVDLCSPYIIFGLG